MTLLDPQPAVETVETSSKLKFWLQQHGPDFGMSLGLFLSVYFAGYFRFSFLYVLIPIGCVYLQRNRKEAKAAKVI